MTPFQIVDYSASAYLVLAVTVKVAADAKELHLPEWLRRAPGVVVARVSGLVLVVVDAATARLHEIALAHSVHRGATR
ncbi:hypothetical protein ACIQNU_02555 [Streptomyces sp. NPDC091292]|uniref:hypothetical protein n=1 Tax=Streptomyces sp. NPDC091292 TaxID=3365991 RepID=UPI00382ADD55